jgi:hypothetical protein
LNNLTRIPDGPNGLSVVVDERKLLYEAVNAPYTGDDPVKQGLTKIAAASLSVANRAADGDPWAITFLFDRLYGKAKAVIESTRVTATLKDYLQYLDGKNQESPIHTSRTDAIDAELANGN